MTIRIVAPANAELRETVRWYEMRRTGPGGEFFDAFTATISRIHARPEIGTAVAPDGDVCRSLVGRFPYQVVYRLQPNEIIIVAVAHMKRRPGYWTRRR